LSRVDSSDELDELAEKFEKSAWKK